MAGRVLVLGGGGVTGVAWELGVLAGLAEAGVELAEADVVIGTSAGSAVGAQLRSGTPLEDLYARQLATNTSEVSASLGLGTLLRYVLASLTRDERKARARLGALALHAKTVSAEERRAAIASRLPDTQWPARALLITAVAADDGEFVVFDRDSGVSLVDAVGASCAVPGVWPPVRINGRAYIDGGMRSPASVDLAANPADPYDAVVVLAPTPTGLRTSHSVSAELATLPATTRRIAIAPDQAARSAIGRNVLDPSKRPAAAEAGRRQAVDIVDRVAAVWGSPR